MLNPETLNKQYDSIKNELLNTYSKDPQPLKADRECPLLSQKKSGGTLIEFKRKLDEKETLLNRREDKLNMKQAALEGREMKLRSWEDRIDNLLGIT
jgi:hypothetical protein